MIIQDSSAVVKHRFAPIPKIVWESGIAEVDSVR